MNLNRKKNLVQCICIDYQKIYVLCPHKNCCEHIHIYPSGGNINNRYVCFKSICLEDRYGRVCIRIDKTTRRVCLNYYLSNKAITFSKIKFRKQEAKFLKKQHKINEANEDILLENKQKLIVRFD